MSPGRYRTDNWLKEFENHKCVGSFDLTVPVEGRILQAQVRPSDRKNMNGAPEFYSVVLNRVFLGHLMKDESGWKAIHGLKSELIQTVGRLIEEREKK